MRSRTLLLVIGAMLVAAACAGAPASPGPGAATPTPGLSQPAAQPPEPPADVVMCELVTGADVAAASPYSIPFEKVQPESSLPQSCVYRFSSDDESASIRIDLVDFASQADASASLRNPDQAVRDTYTVEPEVLTGIEAVRRPFARRATQRVASQLLEVLP